MRSIARVVPLLVWALTAGAQAPVKPAVPREPVKEAPKAPPKAKAPPAEVKKARGLTPPDSMPQLAREYLRRRMERHERDMQDLMAAVLLLEKQATRELATRIATEPRLARPPAGSDGDDTLNQSLPTRFFLLQDELRLRAQKVADATKSDGDQELAEAFGRMTETCVACHSAYMRPEPAP